MEGVESLMLDNTSVQHHLIWTYSAMELVVSLMLHINITWYVQSISNYVMLELKLLEGPTIKSEASNDPILWHIVTTSTLGHNYHWEWNWKHSQMVLTICLMTKAQGVKLVTKIIKRNGPEMTKLAL